MSRPSTVLLDAGGVLLDLDYAYLRRLLAARGVEVTDLALSEAEAIARTEIHRSVLAGGRVGEAWRDYFRVVLRRVEANPEEYEEIIDGLWEAHNRIGLWTVAIPGGPQTVRSLKEAGYRIGVISNAEGRVEKDLYAAGYAGLLDTVVDSFYVGIEKPDPAIFRIALERLGATAESAVYLGDVPSVDVVGARAAGIHPILLDRHDLYADVEAPRLRTIEELPDYLAAR